DGSRHTGFFLEGFRRVLRTGHEFTPLLEGIPFAAFADEGFVHQTFGHDHMRHRGDDGDVGARTQLQVIVGLDVRGIHQFDGARIDDDQLRALTDAALHLRTEHRVRVGRVGTHHHDDVRIHHGFEGLRAGGFAHGHPQAVARGRVTHARAGVDVVVLEYGTYELLHQVGFFVGAARGCDAADGFATVLGLDALEFGSGVVDRLFPRHFLPRIVDALADGGLLDA